MFLHIAGEISFLQLVPCAISWNRFERGQGAGLLAKSVARQECLRLRSVEQHR